MGDWTLGDVYPIARSSRGDVAGWTNMVAACIVVSLRRSAKHDGGRYEALFPGCITIGLCDRFRYGAGDLLRKQSGRKRRQAVGGCSEDQLHQKVQEGRVCGQGGRKRR